MNAGNITGWIRAGLWALAMAAAAAWIAGSATGRDRRAPTAPVP